MKANPLSSDYPVRWVIGGPVSYDAPVQSSLATERLWPNSPGVRLSGAKKSITHTRSSTSKTGSIRPETFIEEGLMRRRQFIHHPADGAGAAFLGSRAFAQRMLPLPAPPHKFIPPTTLTTRNTGIHTR